jgi:DNA-binding IscR family transcriptional regulator
VSKLTKDAEEMGNGPPSRATVKSADRVLTLFELLGRWGREMSHAEIADVMGIPKSSLSQLLKNLVGRGWLAYSPGAKGYVLGQALIDIARGAAQTQLLPSMSYVETVRRRRNIRKAGGRKENSPRANASFASPVYLATAKPELALDHPVPQTIQYAGN